MNDILIMAVGGAGCGMARDIQRRTGGRVLAINTDAASLERSGFTDRFLVPGHARRGVQTAREAGICAWKVSEDLAERMKSYRVIVLAAGLGGAAGTGIAPVIAELAAARGIRLTATLTLPFDFETTRRGPAELALERIRATGAVVTVHDHAQFQRQFATLSLTDAFARVADKLATAAMKQLNRKGWSLV